MYVIKYMANKAIVVVVGSVQLNLWKNMKRQTNPYGKAMKSKQKNKTKKYISTNKYILNKLSY